MDVGRIFFQVRATRVFSKMFPRAGAKNSELCFFSLKTKKTTFFCWRFQNPGETLPPCPPPFRRPWSSEVLWCFSSVSSAQNLCRQKNCALCPRRIRRFQWCGRRCAGGASTHPQKLWFVQKFFCERFHKFLPRFTRILPEFSEILPEFSPNQNVWRCTCTPCTPASYTTVVSCRLVLTM